MSIVTGTKNHYKEYCRLVSQTDAQHAEREPDIFKVPDPIGRHIEYFESILGPDTEKAIFFSDNGDACDGFIQVCVREIPNLPVLVERKTVYINDLVVDEQTWSKGLGRALMDRAVQWANDQGIKELSLNVATNNTRAVEFYKKYGMDIQNQTMRLKLNGK